MSYQNKRSFPRRGVVCRGSLGWGRGDVRIEAPFRGLGLFDLAARLPAAIRAEAPACLGASGMILPTREIFSDTNLCAEYSDSTPSSAHMGAESENVDPHPQSRGL